MSISERNYWINMALCGEGIHWTLWNNTTVYFEAGNNPYPIRVEFYGECGENADVGYVPFVGY